MTDLYQTIADRLRPLVTAAADVVAATSAAEAETLPLGPVPIVLVVPAGERWSEPGDAGFIVSVFGRIGFSCVVALTLPGGAVEWTAVRDQIRGALLGWTPDVADAVEPVRATGARLLTYSAEDGGRWLHSFDFSLPVQTSYGVQT